MSWYCHLHGDWFCEVSVRWYNFTMNQQWDKATLYLPSISSTQNDRQMSLCWHFKLIPSGAGPRVTLIGHWSPDRVRATSKGPWLFHKERIHQVGDLLIRSTGSPSAQGRIELPFSSDPRGYPSDPSGLIPSGSKLKTFRIFDAFLPSDVAMTWFLRDRDEFFTDSDNNALQNWAFKRQP